MTLPVQINNVFGVRFKQYIVRGIDYAEQRIKDYVADAKENPITNIAGCAIGSIGTMVLAYLVHNANLARDPNLRIEAIAALGAGAGLFSAIVPHVLNYVGKTISDSCTAQDGYCNRGITAISKIRIGSQALEAKNRLLVNSPKVNFTKY